LIELLQKKKGKVGQIYTTKPQFPKSLPPLFCPMKNKILGENSLKVTSHISHKWEKEKKKKGEYSFSHTLLKRKIAKFQRKMFFKKTIEHISTPIFFGAVRGAFFVPAFLLSGQILQACCNSMLNPTWDVHL
jgi:hypothetical protein